MTAATLLERRRDGMELSERDFTALLASDTPDCAVAAMLMALAMGEASESESIALTSAYVASGRQITWPDSGSVVDKHSTGCVGDDVSIVLAPLLASMGVRVGKLSGGALRHCGGTLDKLACIPGLRLHLSVDEFVECVEKVGFCIAGQSDELVPADARTYALRERVGTVEVPALIAASVMSKKLACGAGLIALEVKYGSGGLIADVETADHLAGLMRRIGEAAGRTVLTSVSEASALLAPSAGPLLELEEAVNVLTGHGSALLREHVVELAARVLVHVQQDTTVGSARIAVRETLLSGAPFERLCRYVAQLDGDLTWLTAGGLDKARAPFVTSFPAPADGTFDGIDARPVGEAAQRLAVTEGPLCGVRILAEPGKSVASNQPLLEVHSTIAETGRAVAETLGRHCRVLAGQK